PTAPMFEHVVSPGPQPRETLGQALRRILAAERMSQADLGRLINRPQPTISAWKRDKAQPREMGQHDDLWLELAKFDVEHEPRPTPVTRHVTTPPQPVPEGTSKEELIELIRSVKVEEPKPGTALSLGLRDAVGRWARAKDALAAAQ